LFCTGQTGRVCWKDNWVAFLDNVLQMALFQEDSRDLLVPTSLQKLTIDAKRHSAEVQELNVNNSEVGALVPFTLYDIVEIR
jgi:fatty acid synthase